MSHINRYQTSPFYEPPAPEELSKEGSSTKWNPSPNVIDEDTATTSNQSATGISVSGGGGGALPPLNGSVMQSHPYVTGQSGPRRTTPTASVSGSEKKVSFVMPSGTVSRDMRTNDDEFAYVAHLILNYLRDESSSSGSASGGGTKQHQNAFFDAIDSVWYVATGSPFYGSGSQDKKSTKRPAALTDKVLENFEVALKFRMKFLPHKPSPNETPIVSLTREAARLVSKKGIPYSTSNSRLDDGSTIQTDDTTTRGDETSRNTDDQIESIPQTQIQEEERRAAALSADFRAPNSSAGQYLDKSMQQPLYYQAPASFNTQQNQQGYDPNHYQVGTAEQDVYTATTATDDHEWTDHVHLAYQPPLTPQEQHEQQNYQPQAYAHHQPYQQNIPSFQQQQTQDYYQDQYHEPRSHFQKVTHSQLSMDRSHFQKVTHSRLSMEQAEEPVFEMTLQQEPVFEVVEPTPEANVIQLNASRGHITTKSRSPVSRDTPPDRTWEEHVVVERKLPSPHRTRESTIAPAKNSRRNPRRQPSTRHASVGRSPRRYHATRRSTPQGTSDEMKDVPLHYEHENHVQSPPRTPRTLNKERDRILEAIEKLDRMVASTANTTVKRACVSRRGQLKLDLELLEMLLSEREEITEDPSRPTYGSSLEEARDPSEESSRPERSANHDSNSRDHKRVGGSALSSSESCHEVESSTLAKRADQEVRLGPPETPEPRSDAQEPFEISDGKSSSSKQSIQRRNPTNPFEDDSDRLDGSQMTVETPPLPRGGQDQREVRVPTYHVPIQTPRNKLLEERVGRWCDGLGGCCVYGPTHPAVVVSLLFPYLSLAQVMTRLKLNWIGLPSRQNRVHDTFRISLLMSMFWVVSNCLIFYFPHEVGELGLFSVVQLVLFCGFNSVIYLYLVTNTVRVRRRLRKRFLIPGKASGDLLVSLPFLPFVLMQMHRHTTDYGTYSASCFSSNGLPHHVPIIMPPPAVADESVGAWSPDDWDWHSVGYSF